MLVTWYDPPIVGQIDSIDRNGYFYIAGIPGGYRHVEALDPMLAAMLKANGMAGSPKIP